MWRVLHWIHICIDNIVPSYQNSLIRFLHYTFLFFDDSIKQIPLCLFAVQFVGQKNQKHTISLLCCTQEFTVMLYIMLICNNTVCISICSIYFIKVWDKN